MVETRSDELAPWLSEPGYGKTGNFGRDFITRYGEYGRMEVAQSLSSRTHPAIRTFSLEDPSLPVNYFRITSNKLAADAIAKYEFAATIAEKGLME